MTIWIAILLGIVQGIAEFLPISSSGHLSLFQNLLGLNYSEEQNLFFTVLLHFGTLIAVILSYWSDLRSMARETVEYVKNRGKGDSAQTPAVRKLLLVIIGTLPLVLILPIHNAVEGLFSNTLFVGLALIVTGFILLLTDRIADGTKNAKTMTIGDALLIGLGQAVAVLPGVSRSGTTTAVALCQGANREFAVNYSFLLSIPAVLGSFVLSLYKAFKAGVDWSLMPMYLVGMLVAALVGLVAIQIMRRVVRKAKLCWFSYYLWGVGALTLILSLLKVLQN